VSLDLGGKIFQTMPIVLPSQGIDVILGMNWMKEHCAILDTSSRVIQLNSPTYVWPYGCSSFSARDSNKSGISSRGKNLRRNCSTVPILIVVDLRSKKKAPAWARAFALLRV